MNIQNIPIGIIDGPQFEMRDVVEREALEELAQSIKKNGLIQPLRVVRRGERYEIVAGHRRYLAAKTIALDVLPCDVVDDDSLKIEEAKIHENLIREDVNCVDEANYYRRLVDEKGYSVDAIVKIVGRGAAYVEGRFEISRWDEKVKAALSAKHISIALARELVKFKDQEARWRFLTVAVGNGVTARTMESWRQQYEAEEKRQGENKEGNFERVITNSISVPSTYCECCGKDLKGMVLYYVPLDLECKEWLAAIRFALASGKELPMPPHALRGGVSLAAGVGESREPPPAA